MALRDGKLLGFALAERWCGCSGLRRIANNGASIMDPCEADGMRVLFHSQGGSDLGLGAPHLFMVLFPDGGRAGT